jgi:hypothetical protein
MKQMIDEDEKFKTIFLIILFAGLIWMIVTASTTKKPKIQEKRMAHPVAYQPLGDSVKVYFVWEDSVGNKVFSVDTSVMYHISNKPDFKTNIELKVK